MERGAVPNIEFDAVGDEDIPGCRALLRAILLRAVHDACGATCSYRDRADQLRIANQAWQWLHATNGEMAEARHQLCEQAGYDYDAFDWQVRKAEIPAPTVDTLLCSWSILERAYWKMSGCVGPEPVPELTPNPFMSDQPKPSRPTTRAGRRAGLKSAILQGRFDARVQGNGRRDSLAFA